MPGEKNNNETPDSYDYIVVGGGSSGCVVAARLAEENVGSVLLIEAGNAADKNPETMSADGFIQAFSNDNTMWDRLSAPQTTCADRRLYVGTGTGMGGSGAVNGMVYTRGDARDYEQWPTGWKWQDLAPCFEQLEQRLRVKTRAPVRFTENGIEAACAAGFTQKNELNDGDLCGFIGYQLMNYDGDHRRSSYMAFLRDQNHEYLSVKTDAKVLRILFEAPKGAEVHARATAIEIFAEGRQLLIHAKKEIILCAGALETPKLLMLSGIGPQGLLRLLNIPVVVDAPAIGKNLQDHPNVCLFYRGNAPPDAFYPQVYGFDRVNQQLPLPVDQADTCFVFYSAPTSIKQSMQRMLPALALPAAQFHNRFLRRCLKNLVNAAFMVPFTRMFVEKLYGIVVILGKPLSRGEVRIVSNSPYDAALVDPAFYRHPQDIETMINGVMRAQQIAAQPAFLRWGNSALSAGARTQAREKIRQWIHGATMTTFHFCGTCKLGEDLDSPVDLQLRLKGVINVRIADASVIPEIPVSALNAPSMMVGYRAVEFILQEQQRSSSQMPLQNSQQKIHQSSQPIHKKNRQPRKSRTNATS